MISFVWLITRWSVVVVGAQCIIFFEVCKRMSPRMMPKGHGRSEVSSDQSRRVCKDLDGNSPGMAPNAMNRVKRVVNINQLLGERRAPHDVPSLTCPDLS
jgi:hypothetical protein